MENLRVLLEGGLKRFLEIVGGWVELVEIPPDHLLAQKMRGLPGELLRRSQGRADELAVPGGELVDAALLAVRNELGVARPTARRQEGGADARRAQRPERTHVADATTRPRR